MSNIITNIIFGGTTFYVWVKVLGTPVALSTDALGLLGILGTLGIMVYDARKQ
jgi:hypothetical protein